MYIFQATVIEGICLGGRRADRHQSDEIASQTHSQFLSLKILAYTRILSDAHTMIRMRIWVLQFQRACRCGTFGIVAPLSSPDGCFPPEETFAEPTLTTRQETFVPNATGDCRQACFDPKATFAVLHNSRIMTKCPLPENPRDLRERKAARR